MERITIGYDGKRAVCNFTGLGNYSRLIVASIADAMPQSELLVYTPRSGDGNPRLRPMLDHPNVSLRLPRGAVWQRMKSAWRSYGITRQLKTDGISLYHGLSGELPLNIRKASIPSVVTVHDLIFRRHPEYYKTIDRRIYDYKFRRACLDATRIIAISERTKADIMEYYHIKPEKIDVIYQGCDPQFLREVPQTQIDAVRSHYNLPDRYIITVGTVESRKNQLLAVKALRELPSDVKLAIVGRRTRYADEIAAYAAATALTDRVIWIEGAPFDRLSALYAGAVASTYTSRYEGFGIPVIESIGVGTPCIVASGSCLEEAGGPTTPVVDPDSPSELAQHLNDILHDSVLTKDNLTQARKYITRFNTATFTQQIIETYQKTINQYGQRQ